MADDSDPSDKKPEPGEDVSLVAPSEGAPPPPANVQFPAGSVNIALMQNPNALALLPTDLQQKVVDGIEKDNERQFDLTKMQLEMQERGRTALMQERQESRRQMLDERKHVRRLVVGVGAGITLIGSAIYVYLVATGKDAAAAALFADSIKVLGGALGGGGLTAIYKNSKRNP